MASPTPVLPEVGSTIVPPGLSLPSRSAASIIGRPMRSFTEPPGFRYSSLARICAPPRGESLSRRAVGVAPTSARMVGYSATSIQRDGGIRRGDFHVTDERERGDDAGRGDARDDPERERVAARQRGGGRAADAEQMIRMRHGDARRDRDADRSADL